MRAPHVLLAPLLLGPCSAFFGPRVQISVCESALLPAATEAFVDSFWLSKSETGALGEAQRRQLARDQLADFQKRYGGAGAPSERRGALLVATTPGGEVLGCAGVDLDPAGPRGGGPPRMSNLAVSAQARKRGLGGKLVRACEALAADAWAADELDLEVEEKNKAARGLYAKLGYAVVDRRPEASTLTPVAGDKLARQTTSTVIMQRRLGAFVAPTPPKLPTAAAIAALGGAYMLGLTPDAALELVSGGAPAG